MAFFKHTYTLTGFVIEDQFVKFNVSMPDGTRELVTKDGVQSYEDHVSHFNAIIWRSKDSAGQDTGLGKRAIDMLCNGLSFCWLEADIKQSRYEKDGQKRSSYELVVRDFHIHQSKAEADTIRAEQRAKAVQVAPSLPAGITPELLQMAQMLLQQMNGPIQPPTPPQREETPVAPVTPGAPIRRKPLNDDV